MLEDLGTYRCAAVSDVVAERFDGHPYAARRTIDSLKARGLVGEFEARGPRGGKFRVLHLTDAGRRRLEAGRPGGGQRYWSGRAGARQAVHDAAVYRAGREECRRLEAEGARVRRVRCDAELKSAVARATEKARSRGGAKAAAHAKREAARGMGLPLDSVGRVVYPDLVIEYEDSDGRTDRVHVEVATGHYRARDIAAKREAGFTMHAADGRAARQLLAAAGGGSSRRAGLADLEGTGRGRGRGRDGGLIEL